MAEAPPFRWTANAPPRVQPLLRRMVQTMLGWRPRCMRLTSAADHAPALGAARLAGGRWARARCCCAPTRNGCWARDQPRRRRRRADADACSPARCCRAWSTPTATPSSAPSRAWPSGATGEHDDFWSWRDRMYGVALRITPEQLRAVAAQLYVELLRGGYTQVCEFHYLQHRPDGRALRRPADAELGAGRRGRRRRHRPDAAAGAVRARRLRAAGAARRPAPLRHRCRSGAARCTRAERSGRPRASTPAWRSIRCAPRRPASIATLADAPRRRGRSTSTSPSRPPRSTTAWPPPARGRSNGWRRAAPLDARWQLVHATHAHAGRDRRRGAQRRRRGHLPDHRSQPRRRPGRPAGLAGRRACRWPRLGQPGLPRLARRTALARIRPAPDLAPTQRRCRADGRAVHRGAPVRRALAGGAAAAGLRALGPAAARAPICWCSTPTTPACSACRRALLDALVFSSPGRPFRDVLVAGRWAVREHRQAQARASHGDSNTAMHKLHQP